MVLRLWGSLLEVLLAIMAALSEPTLSAALSSIFTLKMTLILCSCTHERVYVCACTHACGQRPDISCLLQSLSALIFSRGSVTEPGAHQLPRLPGKPWRPRFHLPTLGL